MDVRMTEEIEAVGSSVAEAFLEVLIHAAPYPGCEIRLTEEHVDAAALAFRDVLYDHLGTELYRTDELSSRQLDAH
jgi:hypothetical protein